MTPAAPVGAPQKLSLPPAPTPNPDAGCTSPCFPVQAGDGGFECVCAV
ncbi:MAG: hypothetical protein H6Q89_1713 [Myxococcaceae bacterium]|nr:hypothetical protein [Myxococcaceae bacterium]